MRSGLAAILLCAVLVGGACAKESFRDDRDVNVELASTPRRIVSLLPSLTESVCALGTCSLLPARRDRPVLQLARERGRIAEAGSWAASRIRTSSGSTP